MNPRFSLALVALVLVGGAVALWWADRQQPAAPPGLPISSAEKPATPATPAYDGEYVLAISWHPAFCETKPNLRECRNERGTDYAADHFSLHGLWPEDDQYCGVGAKVIALDAANRWSELPRIDVTDATWSQLKRVMPGVDGNLERHEWALHGSCAGVSADTYFRRAIALLEEINGSGIRDLLARNVGREVSRNQIRAAFDAAFGDGAGRKVRLDCEEDGKRDLIYELRINLEGDVMGAAGLRALLPTARNAGAGCTGGTVDRVGQQ